MTDRAPEQMEYFLARVIQATAAELDTYWQAVQHARSCGLVVPPGRVRVRFFRDDRTTWPDGITFVLAKPIEMFVRSGLRPYALVEIVCHELSHCHDGIERPDMGKWESEDNAMAFAAMAMARWRGW